MAVAVGGAPTMTLCLMSEINIHCNGFLGFVIDQPCFKTLLLDRPLLLLHKLQMMTTRQSDLRSWSTY